MRVTLTISTELREKIEKVQGLISHALPEKDLLKYLEYLTEKTLRQKTAVRSFKARKIEEIKPASEVKAKNANRVGSQSQFHMELKPFTARQRKLVLAAQKCCQQNDAKSGKACVSNWQLQVDHIIPLWAGGQSTLENAQVLCGVHNRRKYQTQAGVR